MLTLFAPVAAVLLLRPGRLAVTCGSIVTMTIPVGAVLTIAAARVLAFAVMRPIRMVTIVPPLLLTLGARADAEHGIPFDDDVVRLAMASVVGMPRCRGTGAAVAITVTVGPTVLFVSLTAMPAVATAIVMTAAFTPQSVLSVMMRAPFGHRQGFCVSAGEGGPVANHALPLGIRGASPARPLVL